MLSSHSVLAALIVLLPALLSGCTGDAANQPAQTPVSSLAAQSQGQSQPPGPLRTPADIPNPVPSGYVPNPVPSVAPTFTPVPTSTSTPTIDPSLPTATPTPTSTPRPTPTPFPPAPPLSRPVPDPHQQGVQYFSQTGHTLRGAFLDYWNKHGGLPQFGYPITEEFVEAEGPDNTGLQVQYFQRNRFEYHPELAGTQYEVQLGLLGTESATQKGYFGSLYPRYGHATDFSWISGVLTTHTSPLCLNATCGCSIVSYDMLGGKAVELEGRGWRYSPLDNPGGSFLPGGTALVAFGHIVLRTELGSICSLDITNVPIYIVDTVQVNTAP